MSKIIFCDDHEWSGFESQECPECERTWAHLTPEPELPILNRTYVHTNGGHYEPIMFTNVDSIDRDRYPPTVVYQGTNGKKWSRPISDWARSMTLLP